jgi:hypothetical protein
VMLDSTRRGFFAGLLGAAGALHGAITGATPPMVPQCKLRPAPSKDFLDFLLRMHMEGKEFFLHGDISGFARDIALNSEHHDLDITAVGCYQSAWKPVFSRRYISLGVHFQGAQFELEANIGPSGIFLHEGLVNPADFPKTSCVFPMKGHGATAELPSNRFFVKAVSFHHGVRDGVAVLS